MLEKLISEIRQGGTLDASKLAVRLNTSPQMVEAMLEHLRQTGLLRAYETSCSDACPGCSVQGFCDPDKKRSGIQIWQYDEKKD